MGSVWLTSRQTLVPLSTGKSLWMSFLFLLSHTQHCYCEQVLYWSLKTQKSQTSCRKHTHKHTQTCTLTQHKHTQTHTRMQTWGESQSQPIRVTRKVGMWIYGGEKCLFLFIQYMKPAIPSVRPSFIHPPIISSIHPRFIIKPVKLCVCYLTIKRLRQRLWAR